MKASSLAGQRARAAAWSNSSIAGLLPPTAMSATAHSATPPHLATHVATNPAENPTLNAASGPARPIKPLSERQASCLHWAAMGKTSWETARILGVSESTVNFHLCNACEKLGVRGRRAAVVAALRLGLIAPVTA